MRYFLSATHYPFDDTDQEVLTADNLLHALWQFRKLKKQGYDIIDIRYSRPIKIDTSNWDQITWDWSE